MQVPLQIRFHNMASSEALEARVRERAVRLERFFEAIISCRVTIEAPHKQPHKSTLGITIDIGVAGRELVVKRELRHHESRDDAYQAIGVAFDADGPALARAGIGDIDAVLAHALREVGHRLPRALPGPLGAGRGRPVVAPAGGERTPRDGEEGGEMDSHATHPAARG